jgi:RNA-directed DNA polymerase
MDVSEMQRKLSLTAQEKPEHKFGDLYSLLCNEVWLRVAAHETLENKGSNTAGIDGITKSNFLGNFDGYVTKLKEALKAKTFEPTPVRRVYIPKPHSEKKRPLGIPTLFDRIVQNALRMILEPIWESDFSIHSYGFRPNRSTYEAISNIQTRLTGNGWTYQWVIEGDIASYFDTIPHKKLMKVVKKRVSDKNIHELLWKFLGAGVMYKGNVTETLTGTPQGGIISPLLANLYLNQLDKYMESISLNLTYGQRARRRKKGKGNYLYVRYADDFVVLCNGTKAETLAMKEELKGLLSTMGLTLSEEKTKVTHITEGFRFLGYQIIREIGSYGKMVAKVEIPKEAMRRFQHKMRGILAPNTHNDATTAKIYAANRVIRGWCQYYRVTNSPSIPFKKLRDEIFWEMAHWLGRKYKISMPTVMRKYLKGSTLGTKTLTMVLPTDIKAKWLISKTWHNPYTAKEIIQRETIFTWDDLWSGNNYRQGWMDLREEVILLKGTICALNMPDICESKGKPLHPSEVEIDHIQPRRRFKVKTEADRMKHLQPVCTSCHRAKTKSDRKVLSRMT